jgi:FKBP12-rapamycin complex-associated protein
MVHDLITTVAKQHPQALVYPLSVASKSDEPARVAAANKVLDNMRKHCESLVEAALLVSRELIRVAIPWPEMWNEGLEEAWRQYSTDKDAEGMLATLMPLHEMISQVSNIIIKYFYRNRIFQLRLFSFIDVVHYLLLT